MASYSPRSGSLRILAQPFRRTNAMVESVDAPSITRCSKLRKVCREMDSIVGQITFSALKVIVIIEIKGWPVMII
jgi:hypothetical protein